MSDFYTDKRDGVVKNSLAKYGTAMKLVVPNAGIFNAETGGLTSGGESSYSVQGLVGNYRKSRRGQEAIQAKSQYVYLSPSGLNVTPMPGHKLKISTVEYEIVDVETVAPGGTAVLYQVEVRLP